MPHTTEDVKWGNDLCFCIAEKMFCVTSLEGPFKVSMKVKEDEFDELCESTDIIAAPYMARYKWILVCNPKQFSQKEWEHYIRQSYMLIKSKLSKKLLQQLKNKNHE